MSDLYYLNARVSAMRGLLLSRADYEQILGLPDLPALVSYLQDGPYGRSIESVGEAVSEIEKVEEGLRRNFSETLAKLFRIAKGEVEEEVRLIIAYWEIYNLKTILRGKNARMSAEEVLRALIPTGSLDEPALHELCRQPDLRAVVDLLVTWRQPYGRPLAAALKDYQEPKDLYRLELAADRFYFERAFEKIAKSRSGRSTRETLREMLGLLADRTNLLTALMAVEEGIPPSEAARYFIPGGRTYTEEDFVGWLTARNVAGMIQTAGRAPFGPALKDLPEYGGGLSMLSIVERRLDRLFLERVRARRRTDPLGIASVIGYLLDKIREITNLRMILRGRLVNLPEEELQPLLILEY